MRIRQARPDEAGILADIQLSAIAAELPYLRRVHTEAETRSWFAESVLPNSAVSVAIDDEQIQGFASLAQGWLHHLYVRPGSLRRGIGSALLGAAKEQAPQGIQLFVFQRNEAARAFYRRHGFVTTAFRSGAANEELEPDLRMAWAPPVPPR